MTSCLEHGFICHQDFLSVGIYPNLESYEFGRFYRCEQGYIILICRMRINWSCLKFISHQNSLFRVAAAPECYACCFTFCSYTCQYFIWLVPILSLTNGTDYCAMFCHTTPTMRVPSGLRGAAVGETKQFVLVPWQLALMFLFDTSYVTLYETLRIRMASLPSTSPQSMNGRL